MEKINFLEAQPAVQLPLAGTKQRRVLDALFSLPARMTEVTLMSVHGLDMQAPTMWRQGAYKSLVTAGLIADSRNTKGFTCWELTPLARQLLKDEMCPPNALATQRPDPDDDGDDESKEESEKEPVIVPPRAVKPFTPMARKTGAAMAHHRDGSWDFRSIPSHYGASSDRQATALPYQLKMNQ